jgi:hypothetical protein
MNENSPPIKKNNSLDWFLRGALTRIGEMFDGFTGRSWQPSSSLATSELIERLKILLDSKVQDSGARGRFVPHKLALKMQWNKFSNESEDSAAALDKLKNELLTAAVDHINDRRYHTFAPLELEIKQDYFTEGVKLSAGFDGFDDREAEVNVTVPSIKVGDFAPVKPEEDDFQTVFIAHTSDLVMPKQTKLVFETGNRLSVGRTPESNLTLDHPSVSKIHASLFLNAQNQLLVADTGSSNGTFVNGQRMAYGKAQPISASDTVKFGNVEVVFERLAQKQTTEQSEKSEFAASLLNNSSVIGDMEFRTRTSEEDAKTEPKF